MATTKSVKDIEKETIRDLEKQEEVELDPTHPDNFNIVQNKPLPPEFENPPCGNQGHFCLDRAGNYQPEWFQLMIEKVYDSQIDPQEFNLSSNWQIPLNTWVDAPPEVHESLISAVETIYPSNVKAGNIDLSKSSEVLEEKFDRQRFHWRSFPSAQVPK